MSEYLLKVKNINKAFGAVQALDNVNFNIKRGQIYCLAGENGSGKSTLIKIISGVYQADSGEIIIEGKSYEKLTPIESIRAGIQVIYQDFSLFNNLSVAENITIGYNTINNVRFVDVEKNKKMAAKVLQEIGVKIDLDILVEYLPISQRQIVAICRALLQDAKLVIMDEPTTALTNREISNLYKIIQDLKHKGIAVIFVSHKFEEIFAVSDYISVLRNGKNVVDDLTSTFTRKSLAYSMTGKESGFNEMDLSIDLNETVFKVENYSRRPFFEDINFELYKGEILGITGLLGSGRTELAESLFGLSSHDSGTIHLFGKKINIKRPGDAVREGIGYIPEDRLRQGLFLKNEIDRNISATILDRMSNYFGFLKKKEIAKVVGDQSKSLAIKTPSLKAPVMSLSGGNQQRVVLAKWLATNPTLLILNCPTVGVDIGSKSEIHELIGDLSRKGIGIILISDDLPEILALCNRVLVMNKGVITSSFDTSEISDSQLQDLLAAS